MTELTISSFPDQQRIVPSRQETNTEKCNECCYCKMAALNRRHHHATPYSLCTQHLSPNPQPRTPQIPRGGCCHMNERSVSDRQTRPALPQSTEQPKSSHFTVTLTRAHLSTFPTVKDSNESTQVSTSRCVISHSLLRKRLSHSFIVLFSSSKQRRAHFINTQHCHCVVSSAASLLVRVM